MDKVRHRGFTDIGNRICLQNQKGEVHKAALQRICLRLIHPMLLLETGVWVVCKQTNVAAKMKY